MDLTHARVMQNSHLYTVSEGLRRDKLARLRTRMERQGLGAVIICGRGLDGFSNMLTGMAGPDEPGAADGGFVIGLEGDVLEIGDALVERDEPERVLDVMHPPALQVPGIQPARGLDCRALRAMCAGHPGIGIVHMDAFKATWRDFLWRTLPDCVLTDFTAEARECLAEKLPEEVAMLRDSALRHDRVFSALPVLARPGLTERELVISIRRTLLDQGAAGQDFERIMKVNLVSASQMGMAEQEPLGFPGRVLKDGDQLQLLIRSSLVNDVYAVLGRHMTLGPAADDVKARWAVLLRAQRAAAEVLRAGVCIGEAAEAANRVLKDAGYPEDRSAFIYGVGYGLGEPPVLGCPGEDVLLKANACLALAPSIRLPGLAPMCAADTVLIHAGGAEYLTKTPQDIMEVFWE